MLRLSTALIGFPVSTIAVNDELREGLKTKADQPIWPVMFLAAAGVVNVGWVGFLVWVPGRLLGYW